MEARLIGKMFDKRSLIIQKYWKEENLRINLRTYLLLKSHLLHGEN